MCKQSQARDAVVSLRCFSPMVAASLGLWQRSTRRTLLEVRGLEVVQIALVDARPWLVVPFFLIYRHFWWLEMEMQKSCPQSCLY